MLAALAYKELSKEYNQFYKIGEGGFGEVYFAIEKKTNKVVAIKVMELYNKERKELFKNEAKILKKLSHPNICTLVKKARIIGKSKNVGNCEEDGQFGILVFKKMDSDLLSYILSDENTLDEIELKKLFRKICEAVAYCHNRGIGHLDIKSDNVLISLSDGENGKYISDVQICDFGYARKYKKPVIDMTGMKIGTVEYQSPEVRKQSPKVWIEKADIWSLGILLFTCVTGSFPFIYENNECVSSIELNVVKQFTTGNDCFDLVSKLLDEDYSKRPSIKDVLAHPWLN